MKDFEQDKHILQNEEIDELHKEFLDIYNSVDETSIDSFRNKLMELLEHSKKHFAAEEAMMLESNYKAKKEHIDEHNKVLEEMQYFIKIACNRFGNSMLKAYYKEKLPHWFDFHLLSMDSDLAYHLRKQAA